MIFPFNCILSLTTLSFFLSSSRFLLQSLEDLDSSLRKLNSRLFVIRGQPTDVFPRLFKVRRSSDSLIFFTCLSQNVLNQKIRSTAFLFLKEGVEAKKPQIPPNYIFSCHFSTKGNFTMCCVAPVYSFPVTHFILCPPGMEYFSFVLRIRLWALWERARCSD